MHEFLVKFAKIYKKHPVWYTILALFITGITAYTILIPLFIFMVYVGIYYLVYLFKTLSYYKTPDFLSIKEKLAEKIVEYNRLQELSTRCLQVHSQILFQEYEDWRVIYADYRSNLAEI